MQKASFFPDDTALSMFSLAQQKPILLQGGEGRTYKAGQVILKHIGNDRREYWDWIAGIIVSLRQQGFRTAKPIRDLKGNWITPEGWSAWEFLEGNHDYHPYVAQIIRAVSSFHQALSGIDRPDFLDADTPYARADKYAWNGISPYIDPQLEEQILALYAKRKPIPDMQNQIIHGDLNPDNILVSSQHLPGIIDIAPYWRPVSFALAVFAYWIGPWRNTPEVLQYFSHIPHFSQLILRAALRNLLIMSEFGHITELHKYQNATQIILKLTD